MTGEPVSLLHLDFIEIGTSDYDAQIQLATAETRGISVEPIQAYLDALPNPPGVKKVHAAVGVASGKDKVFYVDDAIINTFNLPDWVHGCASVGKKHPLTDGFMKDLPARYWLEEEVEVITIDRLFEGVGSLDLLKIDTEGQDCSILLDYLDKQLPLAKKIIFEANRLTPLRDLDVLKQRLQLLGYQFTRSGDNLHCELCSPTTPPAAT